MDVEELKGICELYEVRRSQYIELFLDFLRNARSEYAWAKEKEAEQSALTQDILHCLELEQLGYHERARLGTMLSEVRRERRKYKDAMEELEPVIQFLDENKKTVNAMEQLLGAVRKQEKYHENRSYHPKVFEWQKGQGNNRNDAAGKGKGI